MILRLTLCLLAATGVRSLPADEPSAGQPWTLPRAIGQFDGLLKRSPFSVPTAEESAPLADRFLLTGAIALDGENQVFVFDRTTLARERVSIQPGSSGLQLLEYLPNPDPRKMRATIRLGDQTATIAFQEGAAPANTPSGGPPPDPTVSPNPAMPAIPAVQNVPGPPGAPVPGANRRLIRRKIITGNQPQTP